MSENYHCIRSYLLSPIVHSKGVIKLNIRSLLWYAQNVRQTDIEVMISGELN
jgi:hypothetical protein